MQMSATALLGWVIGAASGLDARESVLLGLAISVSSTVVVIRTLEDRGALDSLHGRVAVGWLIVQDLVTVFFLVVIPSLEEGAGDNVLLETLAAVAKAGLFVVFMLIVGARVVPWLLSQVARTGSRELFILAVISSALGIATGASLFGLSVALGAFVAGVVVSETETSHQAAADVLPFRDAFAVLFFVSVGMLLDPEQVRANFELLLAVVLIVIAGKALIAFMVAVVFPYPVRTGLVVAAGLAQIGEFSFIVAQEGLDGGLMSTETYNVILAASVISIALNPLAFRAIPHIEGGLGRLAGFWTWLDRQGAVPLAPAPPAGGHVVIAGYGRVGELMGRSLTQIHVPFVVIEARLEHARSLDARGISVIWGDAASGEVLSTAGMANARLFVVCVPDESTALLAITNAHRLNPTVQTVTRARDQDALSAQRSVGASEVVVPEYEGGVEMIHRALILLDFTEDEATEYAAGVRSLRYAEPAEA
jgi:CPA2 family monovalent cation:H+ antiporter-2